VVPGREYQKMVWTTYLTVLDAGVCSLGSRLALDRATAHALPWISQSSEGVGGGDERNRDREARSSGELWIPLTRKTE